MDAKHIVLTRPLPKTGQVISYRTGDDGVYEAGWWRGRLNVDNKTRFIAKTIGGDDVVIDLVTGLIWAADGNEAGCNSGAALNWDAAIDYANSLDFAGNTDWRLPNQAELLSIIDYGEFQPAIDGSFFSNTQSVEHWSSTTYKNAITHAWVVHFQSGDVGIIVKTATKRLRCVRSGL